MKPLATVAQWDPLGISSLQKGWALCTSAVSWSRQWVPPSSSLFAGEVLPLPKVSLPKRHWTPPSLSWDHCHLLTLKR